MSGLCAIRLGYISHLPTSDIASVLCISTLLHMSLASVGHTQCTVIHAHIQSHVDVRCV